MPIFALVDCNNFYASCEKLFDPTLKDTPVVVLSNNDGCVVARSAEAKTLGIPMGAPWFQIREVAERHGVVAYSSNYALYADLSNRVVEVLSGFSPNVEVYSIDESFLDLSGFAGVEPDLAAYGQRIRRRVADWLGLAVCVGIAPTKTLAKLANHCAKKSLAGSDGVCDFTVLSYDALSRLFATIEVGEVWGVGRKIAQRLDEMGIRTVEQLRTADTELIRRRLSVVLERTVRELRGLSCLALEEVAPPKQQIMSSRSFSRLLTERRELEEAVASYMATAAEKLRRQRCLAGVVQVYIRTNIFKLDEPQYQQSMALPLPAPSDDTRVLTAWALRVLRRIYQDGYAYHKAGIMLLDLIPLHQRQASLFGVEQEEGGRSQALMQVLDEINVRYGRRTLQFAAKGIVRPWQMRRNKLSPRYTTKWDEIPAVLAR